MNDLMAHLLLVALWSLLLITVSGSSHSLTVGKRAESAGQERFSRKYDATVRTDQPDEWKPLDYGHPMRDDPTLVYVPPVLDPVHYGIDSAEPLWPIRAANPPKADYPFDVEERRMKPRPSARPVYKSQFNPSDQRRSGTQIDYLMIHNPAGRTQLPRKPVVPHPLLLQAPALSRNRFPLKTQAYRKNYEQHPAPQPIRWNWLHPPAKNAPISWTPRQSTSWLQAVHPPPVRSPAANWTPSAPIRNVPVTEASIDRNDVAPEEDHWRIADVVHGVQVQGRNVVESSTAPAVQVTTATPAVAATTASAKSSDSASPAEDGRLARARARFASFVIQQGHSKVKMYGSVDR